MTQPSTCLFLECQVQLPERLDCVRGGYFTYNDHEYSYTSRQYQQICVAPKSLTDHCIWTFLLDGGTLNEKLCTTTHFSSQCNGWLATECGPCASQSWRIGGYPWGASVPMRFIDASFKLAPQKPVMDSIQQLMHSFGSIRESFKQDMKEWLTFKMTLQVVVEHFVIVRIAISIKQAVFEI